MEYEPGNIQAACEPIPEPQKIVPPEKDEIRDLFYTMRDIGRKYRSPSVNYSKIYDQRVRQAEARAFYKQAVFMRDFTDNYTGQAPFSLYFPYYQRMGYEQLRTYFTWRTRMREGNFTETSLSYAFLYIYELLNNIGVSDPSDGLDKLMSFRNAWPRAADDLKVIDKYIIGWLKDYHIYYELPHSFKEFAARHKLTRHYPAIIDGGDNFDLFCAVSKYDIRKSVFFSDETSKLITNCFYYIVHRLRQVFETVNIDFDDLLFQPAKKMIPWQPFKDAMFYPWMKQSDRRIVLSKNEIYVCKNNEWSFSTVITSENGRRLAGYVTKQMESVLRKVMKYKYKLAANINTVNHTDLQRLKEKGISLEKLIYNAVTEFYREATKTVVTVDHTALRRIRQEALSTQEALTAPEQNAAEGWREVPGRSVSSEPVPISDSWAGFRAALSAVELRALSVICQNGTGIKQFADDNGVMLEVLADGINQKAMDYIGDNILDDEFLIYEDYTEGVTDII